MYQKFNEDGKRILLKKYFSDGEPSLIEEYYLDGSLKKREKYNIKHLEEKVSIKYSPTKKIKRTETFYSFGEKRKKIEIVTKNIHIEKEYDIKNEILLIRCFIKKGNVVLKDTQWNEEKVKIKDFILDKNKEYIEKKLWWYDDGKLKKSKVFKKETLTLEDSYYPNGNKKSSLEWNADGNPLSATYFHKDGTLNYTERYENHDREIVTTFFENEKIIQYYRGGKLIHSEKLILLKEKIK